MVLLYLNRLNLISLKKDFGTMNNSMKIHFETKQYFNDN